MPLPPIVPLPIDGSWTKTILSEFSAGISAIIDFFVEVFELLFSYEMTITVSSAVTTAAVSLATLFFVMQFFSELAAFRMDRIEEAIRLAMKVIVAKIILENSTVIAEMIYEMFWGLSKETFALSLFDISSNITTITPPPDEGIFGINNIIALFTIYIPTFVITVVMLASFVLTIAGIFFEVQIHATLAPIALSTLVNDTTRSTGISFIKSYAATCLQLTVIAMCLYVFHNLTSYLNGALNTLLGEVADYIFIKPIVDCIAPLLMFVCLSTAVKKAGDLTRRMFGV
jgi:hypothetical protein